MRRLLLLVGVIAVGGAVSAQTPVPPAPIIDMALRVVRAGSGGSSIAQSGARGDETATVYAGLGPCRIGAAADDPSDENSLAWRASGRVKSVEGGIATAEVAWQRVDYRTTGVVAGPHVRMALTLPLGERVAVDFVEVTGSICRMDALIFEIGVALDHGKRLSMSGEGRPVASTPGGGRAGGGAGRQMTSDEISQQATRKLRAADAVRAAPTVTRPMPPRQYDVDVWLVPGSSGSSGATGSSGALSLAQRMSRVIGGTGGRFDFPPVSTAGAADRSAVAEISALVIPVGGDQLVMAITRRTTPGGAGDPVSVGWIKAVPLPKTGDVPSFEIPAEGSEQKYGLRLRLAQI